MQDDTGLSVAVEERTFGEINANMGKFIQKSAKDWRGIVDDAAKFVQGTIKKTLAPKTRPPKNFIKGGGNGGGLLGLFGLLPDKNKPKPQSAYGPPTPPPSGTIVSTTHPAYGAPTSTPSYMAPTSPTPTTGTVSSSYGAPSAAIITSDYVSPQTTDANLSYGTNFNDIGPSIQSLQKPTQIPPTTTSSPPRANPFLLSTPNSHVQTTPYSDPIFRSKRKRPKNPRPGAPPAFPYNSILQHSTTPSSQRQTIATTFRTTSKPNINEIKDKDLQKVKLAWYKYYKKASNYVHKYREKIDVHQFKKAFQGGNVKKPRPRKFLKPSPSTPGPHPIPFSGQVLPQLPYKPKLKRPPPTKVPFFTVTRSRPPPPRPPSPK